MEPIVAVELEGYGRGEIDVFIRLTADYLAESHEFRDGFDQTSLPAIPASIRGTLARLPTR